MFNIKLLILLPFGVLFATEMIQRGSIIGVLTWFISYPNQFIVSYAIFFGLINLFYILPRKIYIFFSTLLLSLFSIAALISRQKLLLRGEPLLPWDLKLSQEALTIVQSFESQTKPEIGFFLIVILLATVLLISLIFLPKEKYRFGQKALTALLACSLFFTLISYLPLEKTFSLRNINWSQKSNYEENGMLLGFVLNAKRMSVEEPPNYRPDNVKNILGQSKAAYPVDPDFRPNVIVVMSEAFWDPTTLEGLNGISFSADPIPYFRSLKQHFTHGTLLSPVYGGGTANTEFEVLTGLSTKFLPAGIIPYVQFVHKPLEALPTIYKRQGYEATAIHTYDNWFYRRNIVYQNLGFDKFISKEFFIKPEYAGTYIRDTELSSKILEQIKQSEKPDFIFAISMQAHGPYSNEENPDNIIKVDGNLSTATKAILENYTNIIADVDKSLELLIEGLKEIDEQTLLVFFSDHLPMLGNNYDVYKEAGYFKDGDTYEEYLKKFSVPILVWDNYSTVREDLRLSASFLGSYILERSKKEGSPLTDFLCSLNEKGSNVITSAHYLDRENITEEELAKYNLLQYDFLLGNEYAYQLKPLHKPATNDIYTLGSECATIIEVLIPDENTIKVLGENFSPNHQIYVNNKPIDTHFIDQTVLTADLSGSHPRKRNGSLVIQVKLTDSMQNVISSSNIYRSTDNTPDSAGTN